jgi:hypothetical protein
MRIPGQPESTVNKTHAGPQDFEPWTRLSQSSVLVQLKIVMDGERCTRLVGMYYQKSSSMPQHEARHFN